MSTFQAEDRLLIKDTVEKFIDDQYPFEKKQARLEQSGAYGANWHTFAELGWLALPLSEEAGGLGGGLEETNVLMRSFGRGLIAEPYVEVVLFAAKVIQLAAPEQAETLLAGVLTGEEKIILAHSEENADPRFENIETSAQKTDNGYLLSGSKRVVFQASSADAFLVSAYLDGQPALFKVPADSTNLSLSEFPTIDSRLAADIQFSNTPLNSEALIAIGDIAEAGVRRGILFGLAGLIGELEGIAVSLRKMTVEYLNTREQFGTQIGKFQALQHKLADMVIAEEEIRSLAWMLGNVTLLDDIFEREKAIRSAKARACKAAIKLGEIAVQLHGGIGVTDELIIGHYLRRIIAIDVQYGDVDHHLLWLVKQI